MNKPTSHLDLLARELEKITRMFEQPVGCTSGDSAINEVPSEFTELFEATRAVAEETGCSAWVGHCEAEYRSLSDPIERRPCSCRIAAERVAKIVNR
jgi:hypothetical protein